MLTALKNLGLSEKEAKVYLAALELGSSSVQKIGRQAGVNRATTYVMIESLIKRGLISSFEQGKKRLFAATHPSQLVRLIRQKELDIQELKENLEKDLLPQLLSIHNIAGDKPKVRFFEGERGVESIKDDFLRTKDKSAVGIFSADDIYNTFGSYFSEHRLKLAEKGAKIKAIYTSEKGPVLKNESHKNITLKFVAPERLPFKGEISIYENKVTITELKGQPSGVIIENQTIAQSMESLFNLLWEMV